MTTIMSKTLGTVTADGKSPICFNGAKAVCTGITVDETDATKATLYMTGVKLSNAADATTRGVFEVNSTLVETGTFTVTVSDVTASYEKDEEEEETSADVEEQA